MTTPEARLARLEVRIGAAEHQIEAFGPLAKQVIEGTVHYEELYRMLAILQTELTGLRTDLSTERSALEERRSRTTIALIGASAVVFAAIIAGIFGVMG